MSDEARMREALEQIVLHADMPAGESWEAAYIEVTSMAREALRPDYEDDPDKEDA